MPEVDYELMRRLGLPIGNDPEELTPPPFETSDAYIPGTAVSREDPVAAPVVSQPAVSPTSPLGRTVPWLSAGGKQDIPIQQTGNVRSIDTRPLGGPAPDMANPPEGTASWIPEAPGQAAAEVAGGMRPRTDPLTQQAGERARVDAQIEAGKARDVAAQETARQTAQKAKQGEQATFVKPLQDILNRARIDVTSSDPATRAQAEAAVLKVSPILQNILTQGAASDQMATGGGVGGRSYTIGADGKVQTHIAAPDKPTALPSTITDAMVLDVASGARPPIQLAGGQMLTADMAKNMAVARGIQAKPSPEEAADLKYKGLLGSRVTQVWDTVNKKPVPMDAKTAIAENAKDPANPRYVLQAAPGVQQEQKESIDTPWNIHPLTKGDARIPVDMKTMNRLDNVVTPADFKADAASGNPTMALVDRKQWNTVIAPIKGVWKSYEEVSQKIMGDLGVTTPDAIVTRLREGGAAALGSSKVVVDINAQISHAIRMIRAMGVLGNMASEQIEREIKAITFVNAGTRQDVAAEIVDNTRSQVRNFMEAMTNQSDFTMEKDLGTKGQTPAPAQGGGFVTANPGEEVRTYQGKRFVNRGGRPVQVQ